jgi:hypothetical protein
MTYDVAYTPPEPMFQDTLLAFQAFSRPQVSARIEPDPLGPVNKIVSLMVGERRIKSVLWHVPVGAAIEVAHEDGMRGYFSAFSGPGWRALNGLSVEPEVETYCPPGWYIKINNHVALYATEREVNPPSIYVPPRVLLWRRMRQVLDSQVRADLDAIAKRLGYHREDDCEGDW